MPSGQCIKCKTKWFGWALRNPEHRTYTCGGTIIVFDDFKKEEK